MTRQEEKKVEVIEIWMPVESAGEAVKGDGTNLKLIAWIANGYPLRLADGFALEKSYISQEEYERIKSNLKL